MNYIGRVRLEPRAFKPHPKCDWFLGCLRTLGHTAKVKISAFLIRDTVQLVLDESESTILKWEFKEEEVVKI